MNSTVITKRPSQANGVFSPAPSLATSTTSCRAPPHAELCMGSFLSTGFVQGGFLFWSRLREVGAVGKWPARATAKSLAAAGHLSTAGVVSARQGLIAACRGRSEGSPAVGATIAPQPCIRWSRRGLRAMKQSYASGARLRGAGPFCRRHKGHSSARVTATSDRHRQLVPGSSAELVSLRAG